MTSNSAYFFSRSLRSSGLGSLAVNAMDLPSGAQRERAWRLFARGQLLRLATGEIDEVDLPLVFAVRAERQRLAIRRPGRSVAGLASVRQLPDRSRLRVGEPDLGFVDVVVPVGFANGVGHPLAIGRDRQASRHGEARSVHRWRAVVAAAGAAAGVCPLAERPADNATTATVAAKRMARFLSSDSVDGRPREECGVEEDPQAAKRAGHAIAAGNRAARRAPDRPGRRAPRPSPGCTSRRSDTRTGAVIRSPDTSPARGP